MECLTSPVALTRCPKRVRLDFDSHSGLPPWANGYEGNGDDHGNSIGWGSQVFGLPAEPLTPAASPDSTFDLAESTNPSTLLPHQGECANHVKLSAPLLPLASSPRRPDHCSQSKAFIDCVKSNHALLPSHQASPCVPIHEPLTDFDYNHGNPNQLLELQSLTPSLRKPHRLTLYTSTVPDRYSRPKKSRNEGTPVSGRLPFCGSKTKTVASCDPSNIARESIPSVTTDRDRTFVSSANITSQQTWTQLQNEGGFGVGRLLTFYLDNLCPGRNVLGETNPWPEILLLARGKALVSDAISIAIRCLYGICIYNFQPDETFRKVVCTLYTMAAEHYQRFLNDLDSKESDEVEEFVALGFVLSTIQLLENPDSPSWLEGYKQCNSLLHQNNPGGPVSENMAVQRSHLCNVLAVCVGRGLIFSQLLAPLPDADLLNLPEQATEFNWLLCGNERETLEINGGCGLSRQLLLIIARVSYCVSCLMQKPETPQWSHEHKSCEMAKESPQPIELIRSGSIVVITKSKVAEVTAEAWRITGIIYLFCRLLRLPRNHPSVVGQMDDLARCIRFIPTSGPCFTTQSSLLPVFMLGLVAVDKKVSQEWFEQVLEEPVRSASGDSVPLLLQSLKRIWCWIDNDMETPTDPAVQAKAICERGPWWEKLVAAITESEGGILCVV